MSPPPLRPLVKENSHAKQLFPHEVEILFILISLFSVSFFCVGRIKIAPDCTRWFVERSEERIWIHKPWVLMCCRQGWANGGLIFLICCQQPWTIFLFTAITHFQLKADVFAHLSLLWSIGCVALSFLVRLFVCLSCYGNIFSSSSSLFFFSSSFSFFGCPCHPRHPFPPVTPVIMQ